MLFCELFPPYSSNLPWVPSSPPPPLPFRSNQIPNNAPFSLPYFQQHSSKTSPFNRRAPVSYHKEPCKSEYGPGRLSLQQRDSPRTPFRSIQPTAFSNSTNGQSRKFCDVRANKSIIRNMNPSEHTSNADGRGNTSTSLQPYTNNGYQRREPYSGPSSPVEQRRDFGMLRHNNQQPPQQLVPQHAQIHASSSFTMGPPPGAKVLVDPATGQQYYVPAQPQMAYYPVFYNAPTHQPQPLFYQPTIAAPSGFFVGPPPASPTHGAAPVFFQNHPDSGVQQAHHMASSPPRQTPPQAMHNQPFNSSNNFGSSSNQQQPYRVEIPPSTACGSVCESQCVSPSPYFKRHHQSRVSTESAASSTSNSSRNRHSDDSMSPMARTRAPVPFQPTSPASRRRQCPPQEQQKQSPYSDVYNSSARYSSTTSSSSTSGFASIGVGESPAEHSKLGANKNPDANSVKKSESTATAASPYPLWWGDGSSPRDTKSTTVANISSPRHSFKPLTSQDSFEDKSKESPKGISNNEPNSRTFENADVATQSQIQKPIPQKAIRMDFDFKRPTSPEQAEQKVCVKANVNRAAPPTCFTISFDDDKEQDGASKKPTGAFSLQDAARQAPTGRRLMRRSAPTNRASNAISSPLGLRGDVSGNSGSDSGGQDPKHYLFKKMIQGYDSRTRKTAGGEDDHMSSISQLSASSAEEKRESDVLSEAGTYIVDEKNRHGTCMLASQIIDSEDENDSESSTATTISESTTGNSAGAFNLQDQKRAEANFTQKIAQVPEINPVRRSLMSDLRKLREENANRVNTSNQSSPRTTTTQTSSAMTNSGLQRTSRVSSAQTSSAVGQSRPPPRPCQQQNRPATTTNAFRRGDGGRFSMRSGNQKETMRPPFRTGLGGSVKSAQKQNLPNESPEMVAWLRRKEYDPRKAAAEARKMQQLKQRDMFINNRSVSYHNAGGTGFKNWRKQMGDERSNKSHDDLSRVGEECEDLSQFSIPGSSNSSLRRTIDELTDKCHKSIALIRITNKDSLSESVENLLQRVVEPDNVEEQAEPSEHISNRLERLSEAFDAIQKYLEEQSTSDSPSMNRKILSNLRPRASSGSSVSRTDFAENPS